MTVWDDYADRYDVHGTTKRSASLIRYRKFAGRHLPDHLNYQTVEMEGVETEVAIINSDNLNEKYIFSMPGGHLDLGGLVLWEDNYWLITELDAADEVYARGKLLQCNYLLKWIDDQHVIHEQWCQVEDGTKYLTGELEDRPKRLCPLAQKCA